MTGQSLRPPSWLAALLTLSLAGCLGEHKVSLGPASLSIDGRLVGSWRCMPFSSDDPDVVLPLRFDVRDATHYEISLACDGPGQSDCHFRAHLTSVGHTAIINAQGHDEKGKEDGWLYARYSLYRPDLLHLEVVDDEHVFDGVPETPEAFRRTLSKKLKEPKTFLDYLVCVRSKEKPAEASPSDPPSEP